MTPVEAGLVIGGAFAALLVLRKLLGDRAIDLSRLTIAFAPLNRVRFALRRRLGWSRGLAALPHEDKDGLFAHLEGAARDRAIAREKKLRSRYELEPLRARSTCEAYRENLYVLDALESLALDPEPRAVVRAVDVGSKDFVYAFALAAFARKLGGREGTRVEVDGVEIDGHVIYRDLHSRADYGAAWAALAGEGVRYHVRDFLAHGPEETIDLVTMFYPFVTRFALLRWGLPKGEYRPEDIFAHAASMLAPGGLLVVANHTHEERDKTKALVAALGGFDEIASRSIESDLVDYFEDVRERTITAFRKSI